MVGCPNLFATTAPWVLSTEFGTIWGWTGSIAAIPPGFVVCDGTNGTPDLRDRFIPGAASVYAVGASGGAAIHVHPFTGDGHGHIVAAGASIFNADGFRDTTSLEPAIGTTDNGSTLAPYYALIFLQYIL